MRHPTPLKLADIKLKDILIALVFTIVVLLSMPFINYYINGTNIDHSKSSLDLFKDGLNNLLLGLIVILLIGFIGLMIGIVVALERLKARARIIVILIGSVVIIGVLLSIPFINYYRSEIYFQVFHSKSSLDLFKDGLNNLLLGFIVVLTIGIFVGLAWLRAREIENRLKKNAPDESKFIITEEDDDDKKGN